MLSVVASIRRSGPVMPRAGGQTAQRVGPVPVGPVPVGSEADRDITESGRTDGAVIERSWTEPDQFAVIFDRHAAEIHRYACRRLGAQAAADVLSEVFLAAFRSRLRYWPERSDARPWLYGIASNVISDHLRAIRRDARLRAALPEPRPSELHADEISDRLAAREQAPQLMDALRQLPAADRELVLLIAWAELSYSEAAEALEIPEGTVRSRLHRARAKLRKSLAARSGMSET
jgi:RNA polymerase sigma factor (sigma-70 family)